MRSHLSLQTEQSKDVRGGEMPSRGKSRDDKKWGEEREEQKRREAK